VSGARPVSGQARAPQRFPALALTVQPSTPSVAAAPERSTPALAAAGLVGGAVGLVGGAIAGMLIAEAMASPEEEEPYWDGLVPGAALGEAVLLPVAIHVVNRPRGNLGLGLLVSVGIAGLAVAGLEGVHWDPPGSTLIAIATPLAQLGAVIAVERATAR
jgi:hypothetical protein